MLGKEDLRNQSVSVSVSIYILRFIACKSSDFLPEEH